MKINGFSNIQKVMNAYGASKPQETSKSQFKEDKIEISQAGREYQIAMEAARKLPDIRQEKVEAIRLELESGTYKVDADKIARGILKGAIGEEEKWSE